MDKYLKDIFNSMLDLVNYIIENFDPLLASGLYYKTIMIVIMTIVGDV